MRYQYITTTDATQVHSGKVRRAIIQVNADLTGSIKVIDGTSGSTANVATITDPTAGDRYEYVSLENGFRVIASAACDVTAMITN